MDITAAEEEIMRWKVAAEQEAAAGKAVEQEFLAQVCSYQVDWICPIEQIFLIFLSFAM